MSYLVNHVNICLCFLSLKRYVYFQIVNKIANDSARDNVYAFSYTSLLDIMKDFSSISGVRVVLGYVLMVSSYRFINSVLIQLSDNRL